MIYNDLFITRKDMEGKEIRHCINMAKVKQLPTKDIRFLLASGLKGDNYKSVMKYYIERKEVEALR